MMPRKGWLLNVNKSTGHARHVFTEKLACKDCHSRKVHAFDLTGRLAYGVIRIGRFTGWEWRRFPV